MVLTKAALVGEYMAGVSWLGECDTFRCLGFRQVMGAPGSSRLGPASHQ